jgi:hypothetical protein
VLLLLLALLLLLLLLPLAYSLLPAGRGCAGQLWTSQSWLA